MELYWRLWNFALDGLAGYSTAPLRVASYIGVLMSTIAFAYGAFLITYTLIHGVDVPGYPSLMVVVLFVGGIQLTVLGIIGEYLGRLYIESKHRPLFIVRDVHGFAETTGVWDGTHGP